MTDTPDVVMHIGAHKTATTHLQRSIQQVRQPLVAKGVQFYGPNRLRGAGRSLIRRFGLPMSRHPEKDKTEVAEALADMTRGCERLVLSEENFVGSLQNNWGRISTPIYPEAGERMVVLAKRIAPNGIHVHLGMRSPAGYMQSAYCQGLLSGRKIPLDNYKSKNPLSAVDWAGLVHRLVAVKGVSHVTVWQYEHYADVFDQITHSMFGETAAALITPISKHVHRGLSGAAVDTLMQIPDVTEEMAKEVRAQMPIGADFAPFVAFDQDEFALSDAYYTDQLWQIEQLPKVTFLKP